MKSALSALLATALVSTTAFAHEVKNGPNGGRVADAGDHHVELVVKDATVEVFVTDHGDRPVALDGFKGLAILAVAGKSQRIVLAPSGQRLTGTASGAVSGQPKGVVQITPPNGKTAQARFN